jgi:geranylgeranyl diphosphate synthase type I
MAFQALDDILGIWGDEAETGKSADLDIASRKNTLPVALVLSGPDSPEVHLLRSLYSLDRQLTADEIDDARRLLDRLGAREQSARYVQRYRDEAIAHLQHPSTRERSLELRDLAQAMLPDSSKLLA